jgi:hypothetical protein
VTDLELINDVMQLLDGGLLACSVYIAWGGWHDRKHRAIHDAIDRAYDEARERDETTTAARVAAPAG